MSTEYREAISRWRRKETYERFEGRHFPSCGTLNMVTYANKKQNVYQLWSTLLLLGPLWLAKVGNQVRIFPFVSREVKQLYSTRDLSPLTKVSNTRIIPASYVSLLRCIKAYPSCLKTCPTYTTFVLLMVPQSSCFLIRRLYYFNKQSDHEVISCIIYIT